MQTPIQMYETLTDSHAFKRTHFFNTKLIWARVLKYVCNCASQCRARIKSFPSSLQLISSGNLRRFISWSSPHNNDQATWVGRECWQFFSRLNQKWTNWKKWIVIGWIFSFNNSRLNQRISKRVFSLRTRRVQRCWDTLIQRSSDWLIRSWYLKRGDVRSSGLVCNH